jgi:hypothetical protein
LCAEGTGAAAESARHGLLTARTTLGDVVGFATACFTPETFPVAALACRAHGGNAVEITCAESVRADALAHACEQLRAHGLRLSVHLPAGGTAPGAMPVIVPADHPPCDAPPHLVLRNTADVDLLDKALLTHPAAGFCLDASLACAAGGFPQLKSLAADHADRLCQVNVGGQPTEPDLVALVSAAFHAAGRAVPVIIERPGPVWSVGLSDEVQRLRALARRFLTPYR